jgi:DNA helicase II / ATP-dependent DNA helicase PcrA
MSNETHIIGPPGCGKTTWLSRQVERAAEKYGADGVMVCSFTRAAVAELNSRELPIPKEQIGTLHAMAYHALGMPKIVETREYLKQFSEEHSDYAIDDPTRDGVEDGYAQGGKTEGAKLLQEYSRVRSLMRSPEAWPESIRDFARVWERFKDDVRAMDFTDLISVCLKEQIMPKFEAKVGLFDEAQDFTPLELATVRLWGQDLEKLILVGDGDQCIYSFKGAVPGLGLDPNIPIITLKQSYRVSQAVHAFSEQVISLIPPGERLQREYLPTDEPGEVLDLEGTFKKPERWFEMVQKHLDQYQTVMILASCSYMLQPIIQFFKQEAIPFSNTYRRKRRDWNPLIHMTRQTTAATRVKDYFAGWRRDPMTWTGGELGRWLPLVAKVLKRGGKEKFASILSDQEAPVDLIHEVLPMEQMRAAGAEWILDHLSAAHRPAEYHVRVGLKAWEDLETEPAICIGTVHSVKGGEADAVILFPDLSPEAAKAVRNNEVGPTARMFFVGATRARTSLYLGRPANPGMSLRWP